jgi:hypothetical protein
MTSPTYDTDFYAWTPQRAAAIRAKAVAALDSWQVACEHVGDPYPKAWWPDLSEDLP